MSQRFAVGEYAMIHRTTDPNLDGKIVRILGNSNQTKTYIVSLNPPVNGQEATQIFSCCLKELD